MLMTLVGGNFPQQGTFPHSLPLQANEFLGILIMHESPGLMHPTTSKFTQSWELLPTQGGLAISIW